MRLKGKVAVITGAGSGIGRATAQLFAREGARVVVADLEEEAGRETQRGITAGGGEAVAVKTDVSRADQVEMLIQKTVAEFGALDILHNNAGVSGGRHFVAETTEEYWDRVISVNLKGVFLCSKYAVLEMLKKGGGVIINTASSFGLVGLPGNAAYSAAKGGVIQLTKSMALEYAPNHIRVNCICAGWIDTPFNQNLDDQIIHWALKETPLGRWGQPEEVARAALYLASEESSFVTGTTLTIDGGWTAK
jgi:NAD(P)-dependent dehydrogenase (short-subunit alcohol dehydrogenase family)